MVSVDDIDILNPAHAEALSAYRNHHYDAALEHFSALFTACPGRPEPLTGMAATLGRMGRFEEALEAYRSALVFLPANARVLYGMGVCYAGMEDYAASEHHHRLAIAAAPSSPDCHVALGMVLLQQGKWDEGWREAEWRLRKWPEYRTLLARMPEWQGQPLPPSAILAITCEQGLGDAIHFCRYLRRVKRDCHTRLIVNCHRGVHPLMTFNGLADAAVDEGTEMPRFESFRALQSLPLVYGTVEETIPHDVPYLRIPDEYLDHWRPAITGPLRIGICWAGNPAHGRDHIRSLHGHDLEPLRDLPATFYSLQRGSRDWECPSWMRRVDLHTVFDTAAIITHLDLVISCDTMVAHLAGALAKPVHTLLHHNAEWRWLIGRRDSPWYPTMTLHRQGRHESWTQLIQRLKAEL